MSSAQVDADADLTSAEACEELGIDRSTLTRWVKSGRLVPTRKLPGRTGAFLFSRSAIEAAKVRSAS